MGVFTREKSGRYYVVFYDEESKERVERALGTDNENIAELKRENLERKWNAGEINPFADRRRKKVKLSDAFEFFLEHLHRKDRAESTISTYEGVIERMISRVGDGPLVDVDPFEVEAYCKAEHLKQATRHKRFRHVRAFFNHCVREDLLSTNPCEAFDVSEPKKRLPKAVTRKQLERLCNAVRADYHEKLSQRGGMTNSDELLWRIPIFKFAFFSGLRRSELSRLRWKHVDFEEQLIYIYEQKNKQQEAIALTEPAEEVLRDVRSSMEVDPDPEAFVFNSPRGNPHERNHREWGNNLSNKFAYYADKADLPDHLSLHGLRHGFCTYLAQKGVSPYTIQRLARHSDLSTTMQYVHMTNNRTREEANNAFNGESETR